MLNVTGGWIELTAEIQTLLFVVNYWMTLTLVQVVLRGEYLKWTEDILLWRKSWWTLENWTNSWQSKLMLKLQ